VLLVTLGVFVRTSAALAQPVDEASFPEPKDAIALIAGDDVVLDREDSSALVSAFGGDPVMHFREIEGATVVARVTPMDRGGQTLGSGRVITVGAWEQRHMRLRSELAADVLLGTQLRVEILEGSGRVVVTSTEEMGRGLRLQANSTAGRRRAVGRARNEITPTSLSLIGDAEKSGALKSDTALLYRVYALFSDARLPLAYRGDDRRIKDSRYLTVVRNRFASLSPEIQAAVRPFLIPPRFQGSWAGKGGSSNVIAYTVPVPDPSPEPCDFANPLWTFIDASFSTPVRIWYRVDSPDAQAASYMATTIDTIIWPSLAGLLKKVPASDANEKCNGNSGRLDIYLVDIARAFEMTYQACTGKGQPGYIILDRLETRAIVAHEVFHAFQDAYPVCTTDDLYAWWSEASATWAEDYVFKTDQEEQDSATDLLDVPEEPFDLADDAHEYGAYLLPFYLDRVKGNPGFVRVAWENCATLPAVDAIDKALPGGFAAVWPEFAKYNWNQEPFGKYETLDGLTDRAKPAGGKALKVRAAPESVIELDLGLPRLSVTYKHFIFDKSVRTIGFWNGVTRKLVLADSPPLGLFYANEPATAA
jgi:hypothetical protein